MSSSSKLILRSSDNEVFEVEKTVACHSEMIKNMIDEDCVIEEIPLPNVTGSILVKVIEYCKKHVEEEKKEKKKDDDSELKKWDSEFIKVEQHVLYDLMQAANYLNIKDLLDLTCESVADMIRGKTAEEIRDLFNIENDFTAEEEEEIRKKNAWAFD